jgi:WD40 repeat protein/nucleoside phosphorylase
VGGSSVGESSEVRASPAIELIDFAIERERHLRFVGRDDVLARLDQWLLGSDDTRWVVITGGPGMGKSAVLSAWLARREAAQAQVPHHFVRRQVVDWDRPERIAASLAAQIEAMFADLRDDKATPEGRLPELLGRVSKRLGTPGRLVIVVDGLDEARAEPGENPLPRFLPHVVPAGIRILCATRPTYPHLGWIEARSPARRLNLDDAQWASSNEAVVRGFWGVVAPSYEPPLPDATVAAAIARAGGNVLHAVMLHEVLRDLPPEQRRAERIPEGLRHLIGEVWDRAAATASVRVGLGLLCAAQEALSLNLLAEIAGWSSDDKKRFLPGARQLLLEEPASWAGAQAYRPRHDWVRELMAEQLVEVALAAHHGALADKLATWPPPRDATARQYALRHALIHRVEAGAWADAWRLAADMGFLEAKCRELGMHETEADLARTVERCRASGDEALVERFDDLARALARESHWLLTVPEATAALMWNRLRQLGWSADHIGAQIQVPAGSRFLRVQHLTTRESAALVRDLVGHAAPVTACAVTPDGRRVVSASSDNTLKVWDLASGYAEATLKGHSGPVTACAVTPDGRRVVSASWDRTLKVWDLASGRSEAILEGHSSRVTGCAVTPDGRRVVSTSWDRTLKIWDLASGRAEATLEGHSSRVTGCAVTPDGRRVVSASWDLTLKVWDLASGRLEATLEGHAGPVTACAVTSDGQHVVSASSWDRTLKLWDLASGRAQATLKDRVHLMTARMATPDRRRVVSASSDKTLKLWDLASAQAPLNGHAHLRAGWAMTADGRHVVSLSDNTLKVWDLASARPHATLEGYTFSVRAWVVTPDGRRMVSASGHTLKVWDLKSGRAQGTLEGHTLSVTACAVTPDGRCVVSASSDNTLKVWDLESGRAQATLKGHVDRVTGCAVTPDGRHVVSASSDKTLKIWNLASGRVEATLEGHADRVTACAVTPDGRRVVSASYDKTLKVWDLESRRTQVTLKGHAKRVTACAVTSDGRRVVSASYDKTLKVWDLASGRIEATLEGHAHLVTACAVTPDGRRVVSASGQMLKVWNLASGRAEATLEGHTHWVTACAVTPDGRRAVSASSDNTLKVWDLKTGMCLFTHRANTSYLAVATTATAIIAGDAAGVVWFLDAPSSEVSAGSGAPGYRSPDNKPMSSPELVLAAQRSPMKHTILFLAANPLGTDRLALDREARAIHAELQRTGYRDRFDFVTRWAAEPLDLLRELRELKPSIVHFSGHGTSDIAGQPPGPGPHRDVAAGPGHNRAPTLGLYFQSPEGNPQLVSTEALEATFGAAGSSVKLVILSACYGEVHAEALSRHVGCVVGVSGAIADDAARSFAIGFYGGLGERESVASAYQQGCAAISLVGLSDRDRPTLVVRAGIDADKLILAADTLEPLTREAGSLGGSFSRQHRAPGATQPVDVGILTIREDELRAVLEMFPTKVVTVQGAHRQYTLRHAEAGNGERYTITVLRQVEQGLGETQTVARDLIEDLHPRLILVVGIAGGLPSDDLTLGDVVLSTQIHDFTVEARNAGPEVTYATGNPIDQAIANVVADLANHNDVLRNWAVDLPGRPPVAWTLEGQLEGPLDWQRELRAKLEHHHGEGITPRAPIYAAGPIASSDRLVKDPAVLIPWLATARNLLAVEMESGGVYRAVRERCPMFAIRGISDIVGLKRADAWTKYACASAAAFTRAFLRTRPIETNSSTGTGDVSRVVESWQRFG